MLIGLWLQILDMSADPAFPKTCAHGVEYVHIVAV
jgi:hypothetical protein